MAEVVHACHELPGQELFSYLDNDGQVVDIRSTEVNAYLRALPARCSRPRTSGRGVAR